MKLSYRLMTPADRRFVRSAWSASYRLSHAAGMIGMESWATVMHPQIDRVLDRSDCTCMVAYNADADPDTKTDLLGFVAGDPSHAWPLRPPHMMTLAPLVFYVYVREAYRKSGIARGLFRTLRIDPMQPFVYACKTDVVTPLTQEGKLPFAKWQPFTARFAPGTQHARATEVSVTRRKRQPSADDLS